MDGLLCHRTAKAHSSGRSGSDKRYRACLLAIVLGYLVLVNHFWFTTDDAYITFRYARNLAEGWGPRFNVGAHAPIEGYSNFLWMLLCAGFERVGLDPAPRIRLELLADTRWERLWSACSNSLDRAEDSASQLDGIGWSPPR